MTLGNRKWMLCPSEKYKDISAVPLSYVNNSRRISMLHKRPTPFPVFWRNGPLAIHWAPNEIQGLGVEFPTFYVPSEGTNRSTSVVSLCDKHWTWCCLSKKPMSGTVTFELPRKRKRKFTNGSGRDLPFSVQLGFAWEYLPGFNSLSGVILRR